MLRVRRLLERVLIRGSSEIVMPISPNTARRAASHGFLPRWLSPALLVVAVTVAGAPNGGAHAEDGFLTWIVKSISSDEDGEIIPVSAMQVPQVGSALATGQRISTGTGQHMVLENGRDLVEIGPNTTVSIGDNSAATTDANVDVVTGAIHVEVGKRVPGQTFSIGAPYLVATVKGTKFDVSTSNEASAVSVTEGVVAVSAVASGESIDVTAGNTAIVGHRNPSTPTLAPTPAGGASSVTGFDDNLDSASASGGNGNSSGGSSGGGSSGGGSSSGGTSGSGGAVGDAADAVGGAVGGAAGAVGDAVSGATGAVGGAVGGPVGGAVSGVGGAVGGAVGGVGGALGGALGGLGGNH
jgi:uncharacterized membrane protein YgcG